MVHFPHDGELLNREPEGDIDDVAYPLPCGPEEADVCEEAAAVTGLELAATARLRFGTAARVNSQECSGLHFAIRGLWFAAT